MDENSVSSQITYFSSSLLLLHRWFRMPHLIFVFKQCQSNTQMSVVFFFYFFWGGGGRREGGACAEAKIWIVKENFIRYFTPFSRLSLAFIFKYYPILHVA